MKWIKVKKRKIEMIETGLAELNTGGKMKHTEHKMKPVEIGNRYQS
jgi:hypothetical protein